MGKFDRYKKKSFSARGIMSLGIVALVIIIWMFKKSRDKKAEEDSKNPRKNKKSDKDEKIKNELNSDKENFQQEKNSINNERETFKEISRPLKNKLINKGYNPVSKEFIKEAKSVVKQVNKNKKLII